MLNSAHHLWSASLKIPYVLYNPCHAMPCKRTFYLRASASEATTTRRGRLRDRLLAQS